MTIAFATTRRRIELRIAAQRPAAVSPRPADTFPLPIAKRAELLEKMGPQ